MTLVRRTQNWLPSVFNDLLENSWVERPQMTNSRINVKENEGGYIVEVAAPGMTKEDFILQIDEDNNLLITMEKKQDKTEDKGSRYLRREFAYSKFSQTLILPDNVDKEKISAKIEHGILEVEIPKLSQEEIKKTQRFIEIK